MRMDHADYDNAQGRSSFAPWSSSSSPSPSPSPCLLADMASISPTHVRALHHHATGTGPPASTSTSSSAPVPSPFPLPPLHRSSTASSSSFSDNRTLRGSRGGSIPKPRGSGSTLTRVDPEATHVFDYDYSQFGGAGGGGPAPLAESPTTSLRSYRQSAVQSARRSPPRRPRRFVIDLDLGETSAAARSAPRSAASPSSSFAPTWSLSAHELQQYAPRTNISQRLRRAVINDDLPTARRIAAHALHLAQSSADDEDQRHHMGPAAHRAWFTQRASLAREDCLASASFHGQSSARLRFAVRNTGCAPGSGSLSTGLGPGVSTMDAATSSDGSRRRLSELRWTQTHAANSGALHLGSPPNRTGASAGADPVLSSPIIPANNNTSQNPNIPRPPFPRDSLDAEMDCTKSSLQLAIEYGCSIEMIDWLLEMGHEQHQPSADSAQLQGGLAITRDHLGRCIPHLAVIYNRPDVMALYCSHIHFLLTVPKIAAAAQRAEQEANEHNAPSSRPVSPFGTSGVDHFGPAPSASASASTSGAAAPRPPRPPPPPLIIHPPTAAATPVHRSLSADASPDGQSYIETLLDSFDSVQGRTPLHDASLRGHEECVRLLLELGAAIDSADMLGNTPLHYASSYGHLTSVQLLIEKGGAQFTLKNDGGFSAADYAFTMGDRAALEAFGKKWISDKKERHRKKQRKQQLQRQQQQQQQQRQRMGLGLEDELQWRNFDGGSGGALDSSSDADDDEGEILHDDHHNDDTISYHRKDFEGDDDDDGDSGSTSSSPTRGFSFNASRDQPPALAQQAASASTLASPHTHRGFRSRTPDFLHSRHHSNGSASGGGGGGAAGGGSTTNSSPGPGSLFRGASVRRAAAAAAHHVASHHSANTSHGHGHGNGHGLLHHFNAVRDRAHQYGLAHLPGHHSAASGGASNSSSGGGGGSGKAPHSTSGESLRDRFNLHRRAGAGAGAGASTADKSAVASPPPPPAPALSPAQPSSATTSAQPVPPAAPASLPRKSPSALSKPTPLPALSRPRADSNSSMRSASSSGRSGSVSSVRSATSVPTGLPMRSHSQHSLAVLKRIETGEDEAASTVTSGITTPSAAGGEPNRADVAPWELVDPVRARTGNLTLPSDVTSPGKVIRRQTLERGLQKQQDAPSAGSSSSPPTGSHPTFSPLYAPVARSSGIPAPPKTPAAAVATASASSSDTALLAAPTNQQTEKGSSSSSGSSSNASAADATQPPPTRNRSETEPAVSVSASKQTDSSGSNETIKPSSPVQVQRAQAEHEMARRVESVLGGGVRRGSGVK